MALITNAALHARIDAILTAWELHQDEFQDWIGGVVDGGAGSDGKYPLTDRLSAIRLTLCPAQLEDNVTGAVADAEAAATAAAVSAAEAVVSADTATTQASLAATARTAAQTAQTAAEAAQSGAVTSASNAATSAAAALADAVLTAADVVATAADVVLTNADVVLTNADVVLTAADVVLTGLDVTYAAEWATAIEDLLISAAAGGNQSSDFSALHWAAKAAATAAAIGDLDSLSDTNVPTPTDGDVLTWHNASGKWIDSPNPSEVNDLSSVVTWANVPDANITQGSVTQHEAAIDHDALTNFVAGEHLLVGAIDHDSLLNFVAGEHFLQSAISITESQISDLQAYLLAAADEAITGSWTFANTENIIGGHRLRFKGSTEANTATFRHDNTDFELVGVNTTDFNISGFTAIAAGTVDADFDAITATSYGGITEANLVDKAAVETIAGAWTFSADLILTGNNSLTLKPDTTSDRWGLRLESSNNPANDSGFWSAGNDWWLILRDAAGNIDIALKPDDTSTFANGVTISGALIAATYGGITEANLVDKTAAETISGVYTHTAQLKLNTSGSQMAIFEVDGPDPNDFALIEVNGGVFSIYVNDGTWRQAMKVPVTTGVPTFPLGTIHVGDLELNNDVDIRGKDTGGALEHLISIKADDKVWVGDAGHQTTVQGSLIHLQGAATTSSTLGVAGALTAASFGGISSGNLVDKAAVETIAGIWTFAANLVVGGTVDGRDIASDGTKLDGITAGANLYVLPSPANDIEPVTGNFGSIQVDRTTGAWAGYSINGRHVFMDNGATVCGLYNDTNNEWLVHCVDNAAVSLYYNGVVKVLTTSLGLGRSAKGAYVYHTATGNTSGVITVSTSSASGGANGDMWFKY